jgi:magnesium-transporting ATPase (P-type)
MELLALRRASAEGINLNTVPPSKLNIFSEPNYTQRDLWVNGLWVFSLVCSISTALLATVARQWIYYITIIPGNLRDRAHTRQLRFVRGAVTTILVLTPLLLHISVVVFIWGSFLSFYNSNHPIAWFIVSVTGTVYAFDLISTLFRHFFPEYPHWTPDIGWACRVQLFFRKKANSITRRLECRSSSKERFISKSLP